MNRRIQNELFRRQHFSSHSDAVAGIEEWVEHYNYKRPHQGIGGFLVPAERFHGQADKVLDKIVTGVKIPEESDNITRDIFSINVGPNGKITLNILGHSITIEELENDNSTKQRRNSNPDSCQTYPEGEECSK